MTDETNKDVAACGDCGSCPSCTPADEKNEKKEEMIEGAETSIDPTEEASTPAATE